MSHVLNHEFWFFTYRNITKFFRSIHFELVTVILSKLAIVIYPSLFQQTDARTFTVFISYSRAPFKEPSRYFEHLNFLGHPTFLSYLRLKLPQFQRQKSNFFITEWQSNCFNKFWIKSLELPKKTLQILLVK